MNQPFPDPQNRAQLHELLLRWRDEGVPSEMRAAVWRTAYRAFGSGEERAMHFVAYDTGLGDLTGGDWRYPEDISDFVPSHHGDEVHGIRESQYYLGYQISVAIDRKETNQWAVSVNVMDPQYSRAFDTTLGNYPTLEAAFSAGIRRGINETDLLRSGRSIPKGRSPESVLLRGKSED